MVEMTQEEFNAVFAALEMANTGYTYEQVPTLVALEGKAFTILQSVKARQP